MFGGLIEDMFEGVDQLLNIAATMSGAILILVICAQIFL